MEAITLWLTNLVEQMGYLGIFVATLIESSFVPLPAEMTMIPAGMLAAEGKLNYWLVLTSSTFGVICGSILNYVIGMRYGRALILHYGRYVFIKPAYIEKTEWFFARYGAWATFFGRLLPGVRHYIACVAGIAAMRFRHFVIYTALGGLIWMWILLQVGYMAEKNAQHGGSAVDQLETALIACMLIGVLAVMIQRWMMKHKGKD